MDVPGKELEPAKTADMVGKITVIMIIALFLVVVIVLSLHLYSKWFWWRIEEPVPPSRGRFVFETPLSVCTSNGLDSAVLTALPLLIFRQEDFKDGLECAVCLSELEEGEKARLLPKCNHGFHVECIDMWFLSHSTCPLCRNPVSGDNDLSSVDSSDVVINLESPDENPLSMESPSFPTNVLFWGNETQISSGSPCLEEGASSSSAPSGKEMLVIDVPMNVNENLTEGELKSPVPTRLRSLKRLLSRDKRFAHNTSTSSSSIDV